MYKLHSWAIFLLLFLISCDFFSSKKKTEIPANWEMIEVFTDEIEELNEGGYYGLYYDHDNPEKDSLYEDSDDRIVAIAVSDSLEIGKSIAKIWVADSKQTLVLTSNETVDKKSYHRVYSNDDFSVDLNMKFWERIDGLDEEDMYIYRGKMKVTLNETGKSQEFKVKGGI